MRKMKPAMAGAKWEKCRGSPCLQMLREFNLFKGALLGNLETDGNDTVKSVA